MLFHEASHGIAVPVENAITRECRQRDKPIPRDLWHAVVFYTTSEVLRPVMQEAGPDPQSGDMILPHQANMSRMPPDLREKVHAARVGGVHPPAEHLLAAVS